MGIKTIITSATAAILLLVGCSLKQEKQLAERMALRLGAKAYTVEDSTIYEKKEEHSALVVMFNNPDMKSPELDPLYFSGKTAAAFADSLGPEAINFDYFVMKLDIKGLIYTKRFKMKTLLTAKDYYKRGEDFLRAVFTEDTTTIAKMLNQQVVPIPALTELFIVMDNQAFQYGSETAINILGFEETITDSQRAVVKVRLAVYRQNAIAEVYNLTFDKADGKIVGANWEILTGQANGNA